MITKSLPRILLTTGEPAGIGPELLIELCHQRFDAQLVAVCDPDVLAQRAKQLNQHVVIEVCDLHNNVQLHQPGRILVMPVKAHAPVSAGQLDKTNALYVLQTLEFATHACLQNKAQALVTGPVHKGVINEAGVAFSGHTEYLAQLTQCSQPVMMLETEGLRVALATTHLPLQAVPGAITATLLHDVLTVLHRDLQQRYRINSPSMYVAGLNPHAGEGGHLGGEELHTIIPVLNALREQGMRIQGPLSADTMFSPSNLQAADVFLTMYHDQGLPVLKYAGFGNAVNVTLGLPIVRTSVDHGTALELAGSGKASAASFRLAVEKAIELSRNLNS